MFARDRQTLPWVEQWKRVDRWRNKLQAARARDYIPADEMMDLFYAFFQNVFFIRDWLVSSGVNKNKVRALFSSYHLSVCRDIVNGSKHCIITRASVDSKFLTVREYDPDLRAEVFRVLASGQKIDLYGLAMICFAQLQSFVIREELWDKTSSATCKEHCFGPE